jgi:chromosome segregation ATPase
MADATSAEKAAEIEKILTDVGVEADKLQKLVAAGVVIPRPGKLDDLPEDLRQQVQGLVQAETAKEIKTAKDQLYATLEKHKSSNEELRKAIEEQNKRIREEEQTKAKLAQDEATRALTLEQRMEQIKLDSQRAIEDAQKLANEQIRQLQTSLRKTSLGALREKLIMASGAEIIPELVINPEMFPTATEEDIMQSAELARAKYQEIHAQIEAKRATAQTAMASAAQEVSTTAAPQDSLVERLFGRVPSGSATFNYAKDAPVVPSGNAHLSAQRQSVSPDAVKNMSREQLAATREALLQKYGM